MDKHFCTCPAASCQYHPAKHKNGCDPCIQKNLQQGEIPACFFLSVSEDVNDLTEFTAESFVSFYLKHKGMPAPANKEENPQ